MDTENVETFAFQAEINQLMSCWARADVCLTIPRKGHLVSIHRTQSGIYGI